MLISVVVIGVAILAVALLSQPSPQKIPALDAIISNTGQTIHIFHDGGDKLTSGQINITVDGIDRTSLFTQNGQPWTTWTAGQSLDYTAAGPQPRIVQIIYNAPSSKTVLVTADFSTGMPTEVPTAIPTTGSAPGVSGISPNIGTSGTMVSVVISGSNFQTGASPQLIQGASVISASGVYVNSQSQISCSFSLPGSASGTWNVKVVNPDGQSGSLGSGFVINAPGPAPTVTSITPSSANSGTSVSAVIMGTGFNSTTIKMSNSPMSDIYASSITVVNGTYLTCTFDLTGAPSGSRNVVAINSDGQTGMLTNGFTVNSPAPTVTGITPNSGNYGYVVTITNLAGTNFQTGATVKLNSSTTPDIPATSVVVVNGNQISCTFDLTGAPLGSRNVVVTNTDGRVGMLVGGFTVTANAPSITSVNPIAGTSGNTYSPVTVSGAGFISGATIALNRTGSTAINATSVNWGSANAMTCTISIPSGTTAGMWNVVVTNPDGKSATLPNGFTISTPPATPTFTGIAPPSGSTLGGTPVTITGTNLIGTTAITFDGFPATGVTVGSSTSITATTPANAAGPADIVITTPNGTATGPGAYTYAPNVPTFTSISPSIGPTLGGTTVTIKGTGFTGATGVTFAGIAATGFTVVSDTSITATTPFHAAGAVNVVVTAPGGTASGTYTYTTTAAPTFTSIAPAVGPVAGGTAITITGTNFVAGGLLGVTIDGVPATSVVRSSATTITAVTPAGTAGAKDVIVTNNDGQTVTKTGAYTYYAVPTFTSIAPAAGPIAGGNLVTITGTNFVGTTSVTFGGTAATAVTVVSSTQLTAIAPAKAAGTSTVVVNTPGGAATGTNAYTYTAVPTFTSITPAYGRTAGGTTVIIAGTNFVNGATAVTFGSTPATSLTWNSATQVTATTPANAAGAVTVTVTTPGGAPTRAYTYGDPTISGALSLTTGVHGHATYAGITIPGTNFITSPLPTVVFTQGSNTMTGTVTACTATQVTFSLTIPAGQALGVYSVTVTNTDGGSATRASAFTVT